ncbi:DUF3817 domain-containing protein [Actinomadura parmotrematis]|uniref:DUF3817 domain-containing protein n=1 Tax=Actinomadura parmotrematis TaxID=2864039 RepID=A0ABS7FTX6_9ACTN|nr:DUF3817 domain-containing protein [Actinomadura parmotrematis]MBW8483861.1 DUF3817 domain-containing protein [Actinomadura parmotrematis]
MDFVRSFKLVSLAEATSFLVLLLIAMPLKYLAGFPAAVSVVGALHGMLFLAYVGLAIAAKSQLNWTLGRTAAALAASVLPVAPFLVERYWIAPAGQETPGRERVTTSA